MWEHNPKPWRQLQSYLKARTRIIGILVSSILLLVFGFFFARNFFETKVKETIQREVAQINATHAVALSIKGVEVSLNGVKLSKLILGKQPWLELDGVSVTISLNPFSDFLRPSSINVDHGHLNLPTETKRWPATINRILERLNREGTTQASSNKRVISVLLPKKLAVSFTEFQWFDVQKPILSLRKAAAVVNVFERRLATRVEDIVVLDRIKERFFELELRLLGARNFQLNIRQREDFKGKPFWSASCNLLQNPVSVRCDVDADRLPDLVLSYFQSKLGKVFAPGFKGGVGVEAIDGRNLRKLRFSIQGILERIYLEHPALAVTPVGPINIRSHLDVDVDLDQRSASAGKSELFVFSPNHLGGLGIPVATEFAVNLTPSQGDFGWPIGSFQLTADRVHCESILQTLPENFAPELVGFQMEGDAALRAQIELNSDGAKFSISGSRFNCVVTSAPEMYSSTYLLGPFVIERETPSGKITIPVDPARPYFMAYKDIPPLVRSAFISSEDTGFFRHKGVEIGALVGAVERNAEEKRAAVGGSTITMQTVKNLFLARDKTLSRKMQEIFLAWHLEKTISKERILEIYLNMVEFGPGLYGIGRASQRFFSKDPSLLTLKEAIYLASLLPAPIPRYRYFCKGELTPNYNRIIRQLLDRMRALGRITPEQHASAIVEKLEFSKIEREAGCSQIDKHQEDSGTDDF